MLKGFAQKGANYGRFCVWCLNPGGAYTPAHGRYAEVPYCARTLLKISAKTAHAEAQHREHKQQGSASAALNYARLPPMCIVACIFMTSLFNNYNNTKLKGFVVPLQTSFVKL